MIIGAMEIGFAVSAALLVVAFVTAPRPKAIRVRTRRDVDQRR